MNLRWTVLYLRCLVRDGLGLCVDDGNLLGGDLGLLGRKRVRDGDHFGLHHRGLGRETGSQHRDICSVTDVQKHTDTHTRAAGW